MASSHDGGASPWLRGQRAPSSSSGRGVRVLYRCPHCQRVWLMDGPQALLDLDTARLASLAAELGARLDDLPSGSCRICQMQRVGAELGLDEYNEGQGFGFSYEGLEPPGYHTLALVASWEAAGLLHPSPGVLTRPDRLRATLTWLVDLPQPSRYLPIPDALARVMAQDNPPGHGAAGTEGWVWRGGCWQAEAPEGPVVVALALALPPGEPWRVRDLVLSWRLLAQLYLTALPVDPS